MRRVTPELLAMLAVTAALVIIGGLLRQGIAAESGWFPSDLGLMWSGRGLDVGRFPYGEPIPGVTGLEYPVLTGVLMWLVAVMSHSVSDFLLLSTVVLGLCALGITAALHPIAGRRTWLWAAAPALVWHLCFNYDALASLLAVGALTLLAGRSAQTISRGRLYAAATLLGLGGAAKLYPLLFLLPVLLWLLFPDPRARLKLAVQAAGVAISAFALINLPFLIANPAGWWAPYQFQAQRPIGLDTLSMWVLLAELPASWANLASAAATAIALIAVAIWSWRRATRRGTYPLLPAGLLVLIAYLLANKVYSPQYVLWLLPLLVLAGQRTADVIAYLVVDTCLFFALQAVMHTTGTGLVIGTVSLVVLVISRFWMNLQFARQAMSSP